MIGATDTLDYSEQLRPKNECRYYLPEEYRDKFNDPNPSLSMLHLNARSLNRNLDSIKLLLHSLEHKFSFIGISDSWLRPNSPSMFDIEGYTLLRADRCDGRGGGVALYVENGISFKLLDNMPEISHCETLSIEVIMAVNTKVQL